MSIRVMTAVWAYSKAAGTDLLVLLALADIADDNGECWPSVGYVGRKCRIDPSTARRRIQSLEKLGEVIVIHGAGKTKIPGASPTNRYQITVHMPDEVEGGDLPDPPTDARGTLAPVQGGTLAPVPPNTSVRHVNDTSLTRDAFEDEFSAVWSTYPRRVDRAKALKAYAARRKAGVSADDLMAAVKFDAEATVGTEPRFIKHGATFFGSDAPFADYVNGIPEGARPVSANRPSRNMSTVDAVLESTMTSVAPELRP
jgi:hypothetical protein